MYNFLLNTSCLMNYLFNIFINLLIYLLFYLYLLTYKFLFKFIFIALFYLEYLFYMLHINYFKDLLFLTKFSTYKFNSNEHILNYILNYSIFIIQVFFLVTITIWTRAAGPRFRIDQLLNITWKDLFIVLNIFVVILVIILTLV